MVTAAELSRFPAFADLPDDQIAWFLSQSQEVNLNPGEVYARPGDPADAMFVLLEGEFEWRTEFGVIRGDVGDVTGALPFSRMKEVKVTGRAVSGGRMLRFPAALFPELIGKMPELARRLVGVMADRIREFTRREQQRDRLAGLGKLSAGLAHELNNPASAAKRAAAQLRDALKRIKEASHELGRRELTVTQKAEIEKLEASFTQRDEPPPDALTVSDLEERIDSLLRSHGQNDLWQLAAELAERGIKPAALESLFENLDADTARAALVRIAASVEIASLLNAIESSTSRISELVRAIKEYTFMDQSPVQNVDVVKSLETTLTILNHKLKRGVNVQRDYQPLPLLVDSFGSELNQVWTNLIDNAIDAMNGKGELRVRTFRDQGCVVVEICDDGPGISPEIRQHIFEPFFTTKGVGEGTGLGLDTVQRIVKKHRGNIEVSSKPGDTRFQVWLPLADAQA
ncbi:MAG: GHKL domain-containing protein [Acidobacteria bacterium]|nr:GHKL domain-containing protein [Acidobacteriota bacterium]MBV9624659.1 GHKL domain-containing protein [Acidobacteriota bacterium]